MTGLFVTGTGTGVGKTLVAAGILRSLRRAGINAGPMKPFQTGCVRRPDGLLEAPDVAWMVRAARMDTALAVTDRDVCPYAFEPACSPHLAARMAGVTPDIDRVTTAAHRLRARYDTVIAEGAGGILVPVNERQTMIDVIRLLGWPALVVARGALGAINETLLTLMGLRQANIPVLGVAICDNIPGEAPYIRCDNPHAIERFGKTRIVAHIPWIDPLDPEDDGVWRHVDAAFSTPILEWAIWRE